MRRYICFIYLHPEYLFFSFQAIKSIRNKSTSFEQNKGADHCYCTESAPFHISLFLFLHTWKSPEIIDDKQHRSNYPGHRITEHDTFDPRMRSYKGKQPDDT